MNKKKLISLSLVVIMIAILSFSSLAWFSDNDQVENKFYIASSDDTDPDDIFSVDVWEYTPDGDKDQDGYEYKDILPGDNLKKEVKVENTGYYDQYIRVTVTVSDAAAWCTVLGVADGNVPELAQIVDGLDTTKWNISGKIESGNLVYTLYYSDKLASTEMIGVFNSVKIPGTMTVDQANAFENNFSITVVADAVQTENVGNNAIEAFAIVEGN